MIFKNSSILFKREIKIKTFKNTLKTKNFNKKDNEKQGRRNAMGKFKAIVTQNLIKRHYIYIFNQKIIFKIVKQNLNKNHNIGSGTHSPVGC